MVRRLVLAGVGVLLLLILLTTGAEASTWVHVAHIVACASGGPIPMDLTRQGCHCCGRGMLSRKPPRPQSSVRAAEAFGDDGLAPELDI